MREAGAAACGSFAHFLLGKVTAGASGNDGTPRK